ncbi:hypothetical protein CHS0354_027418 [Potamilus streckersoni]|uniref:O-antigen ligase-related domain-containing protein n=1 Tax=Potamilus streckersoni TaxID=2493646 RepID=A0AAE0SQM1_9BIVA|nr:hypothetical protein CHS0354_027418 [Potamilus streckersoni]
MEQNAGSKDTSVQNKSAITAEKIGTVFLWLSFISIPFSVSLAALGSAGTDPQCGVSLRFILMVLTALIAAAFSGGFSENFSALRHQYWKLLLPGCVLMVLLRRDSLNACINGLLVFAVIFSLYGIAQYFTGVVIWQPEKVTSYNERWHAMGFFSHYITYGGVMLLLFPVFLSAGFARNLSGRHRLIFTAGSVFIGIALMLSLSRSAWLGAFAGLFVLILLSRRKIFLIPAVVAIILLVGAYFYIKSNPELRQNAFLARIDNILDSSDRVKMLEAGFSVAKENLLFGIGPNTVDKLRQAYEIIVFRDGWAWCTANPEECKRLKKLTVEDDTRCKNYDTPEKCIEEVLIRDKGKIINDASVGVHNIYLQLVLNYGIFHLLAYILMWGMLLVTCISALSRKSAQYVKEVYILKGILAGFAGYAVMGFLRIIFTMRRFSTP